MTTLELDRGAHDAEAPNRDGPDAQKRLCIAALMDRHPETFPRPTSAATWTDFVEQLCVPTEAELMTLNMAIGRLVQVMRIAQEGIPDAADLNAMLSRAEQEGISDLEPDAAVQALASPDAAPDDVHVMARAMSLYKTCMTNGLAQGDEISNAIDAGFAHVPVTSPFMQSLVETAKEVALIDVRYALGQTS